MVSEATAEPPPESTRSRTARRPDRCDVLAGPRRGRRRRSRRRARRSPRRISPDARTRATWPTAPPVRVDGQHNPRATPIAGAGPARRIAASAVVAIAQLRRSAPRSRASSRGERPAVDQLSHLGRLSLRPSAIPRDELAAEHVEQRLELLAVVAGELAVGQALERRLVSARRSTSMRMPRLARRSRASGTWVAMPVRPTRPPGCSSIARTPWRGSSPRCPRPARRRCRPPRSRTCRRPGTGAPPRGAPGPRRSRARSRRAAPAGLRRARRLAAASSASTMSLTVGGWPELQIKQVRRARRLVRLERQSAVSTMRPGSCVALLRHPPEKKAAARVRATTTKAPMVASSPTRKRRMRRTRSGRVVQRGHAGAGSRS